MDLPPEAKFFHRNYNNMTAPDYGPVVRFLYGFDADHSSQDFLVVGDVASQRYILIGALTARRSFTFFTLHCRQTRIVGISCYQPDIPADGEPEELVRIEGRDWRDLVIEYARLAAERAGVSLDPVSENVAGYCSWYYYHQRITFGQFMENVRLVAAARPGFPSQIAQIDDGYQAHHGDWLTINSHWGCELKEVGARIREHGLRAGIWLMPLLASTASDLFRQHPDWFVKDDAGQPWLMRGWTPPPDHHWACMDATLPAVREYLTTVFQALAGWGFDYFKLDGMGFMMPAGRRADPNATGLSAFRLALQTIRQAAPGATLLGCCPPYLACLGLVDHARISSDTGAKWIVHRLSTAEGDGFEEENAPVNPEIPCLENAMHQGMARWWMIDRWFRADPDVVIVRQESGRLTEGEARMSALTGILTGVVFTSDHLGRLTPERMAVLERAATLRLLNPRPLAWEVGYWPRAFEGTVDGRRAVAIFNDIPRPFTWTLRDLGFETNVSELLHPMGILGDTVHLMAHDAALLVQADGISPQG